MSNKDPDRRAKKLFNTIAPLYSSLDKYVKESFQGAIDVVKLQVGIQDKSVLDIGTGPGAWAAKYYENGAQKVYGVDFAEKMIKKARERYSDIITFSIGDAVNLKEFQNESFDIVTSSFVIHGVKEDVRAKILNEMKRISRDAVVINDFYGKTALFTRFLEYIEKSDYIHFKKNFYSELRNFFPFVEIFDLEDGSAVYLAKKIIN